MFERLKESLRQLREHHEIDALDRRALTEIGADRGELHGLVAVPAQVGERMGRMARHHGLSPVELQGSGHDYAALLKQCAACREVGTCAAFLSTEVAANAPGWFCPNHTHLTELKAG